MRRALAGRGLRQAHARFLLQVDGAVGVAELIVAVFRLFQLALEDGQLLVQESQRLFRFLGLARQVLAHVFASDLAQHGVCAAARFRPAA